MSVKIHKEKTGNWEGKQILGSWKWFIASLKVGYFSGLSQFKVQLLFSGIVLSGNATALNFWMGVEHAAEQEKMKKVPAPYTG